jgi:DNA-directed RNA polymerase subunit L
MDSKTKVDGIKITTIDFQKDNSKDFKKCLELVPELKKTLPDIPKFEVSFNLKNTNTDIANGLRRVILNETVVKSLCFDDEYFTSTDSYILSDFLRKQINLIPINQELTYKEKISLHIENKTDDIIEVLSGDIICPEKAMIKNIILCHLRPQEKIIISDIKIVEGIGRQGAGRFSNVGCIKYKIGMKPLDVKTGEGSSSLVSNPTEFSLGYITHHNTKNPLNIVVNACDNIISRMEKIMEKFKDIKAVASYYSDFIQIDTNNNIKDILFIGETWTTVNLLARYAFILTEGNIKFVTPAMVHPEKEVAKLRIIHSEYNKIIYNSASAIIKEYKKIRDAFANYSD